MRTQTHNRVPSWNRLCSTMFHPCQNPCYKTSDCSFGLYNAQMLPHERAQEKPRALIFLILNNTSVEHGLFLPTKVAIIC